MKKPKFIPEFTDIPKDRIKMNHLSREDRRLNFREVELGFTEEQAIAEAKRCLSCRRCIGCGLCLAECDQKAIVYDQKAEKMQLKIDAVIMAPGFDEFDARRKPTLGYGRSLNVITSTEFERILNPTGPYGGVVMRPFDGDIPQRIAFVQCVGSRDESIGANFCSNTCCMTAIKQAIIASERIQGLQATLFHRDIRPLAKGSEEYHQQAKQNPNIQFIKTNTMDIEGDRESGAVTVTFVEHGDQKSEVFDLVVLSIGLHAPLSGRKLSRTVRLKLNRFGFCPVSPFAPLSTSVEGLYVAGAFSGPKDISQAVTQASGAAGKAAAALLGNISTAGLSPKKGEKPSGTDKARIGIFFCRYGNQTQGNVDLETLRTFAHELQDVAYVGESPYGCLLSGNETIRSAVKERGVNRVVVVPCYPTSHRRMFAAMAQEIGLDADDVEIVQFDSASTIESAQKSLRTAVEKVVTKGTDNEDQGEPVPAVLILGGGLAGLTATLDVARQGFAVHLVEKSEVLGGSTDHLKYLLEEDDVAGKINSLIQKVEGHEKIHIHKNAHLVKSEGKPGHFSSTISCNGQEQVIEHGAMIIATGAATYEPTEYPCHQDTRAITQNRLEVVLSSSSSDISDLTSVVMVQCVGSRNAKHPWCSRTCCEQAIKNALKMKEVHSKAEITILHRDMRVYGFNEDFLSEAQEKGIRFIRMDRPPDVTCANELTVSVTERETQERIILHPQLLVLSAGVIPSDDNAGLAQVLGLGLDKDGFFKEADPKMRPVETDREGIFICGLAHSPQSLSESLSQASAAAGKAGLFLSKDRR